MIRDGDTISALLTRLGAHSSVLAWEERRMRREVHPRTAWRTSTTRNFDVLPCSSCCRGPRRARTREYLAMMSRIIWKEAGCGSSTSKRVLRSSVRSPIRP